MELGGCGKNFLVNKVIHCKSSVKPGVKLVSKVVISYNRNRTEAEWTLGGYDVIRTYQHMEVT